MDVVITELNFLPSLISVAQDAFKSAGSGHDTEYLEQIARLPPAVVPQPTAGEADLNTRYYEVLSAFSAPVFQRVQELAAGAGLAQTSHDPQGTMDGWPPPTYSGSAAVPRWRLQGVADGPLIEAIIAVGVRRWPTESYNDLVLALLVARLTESSQHMLLTRFVPCRLDEPSLQQKIASVVNELEAILPTAFDDFRNLSAPPQKQGLYASRSSEGRLSDA
ncbi:hypothetical protein E1263_10445 [Kribbella antibiotica]|uniref:Uncharacterized protein n=1 Tax=Kribbella antibiotica TaxID=190195 RepID=A0A4R4ZR56_9ACTN|nr:hypothetical protein [Kribbella antibiotica]TDD60686.1 hypothetical protein E1263_10445 [Kribbella antibiotica]